MGDPVGVRSFVLVLELVGFWCFRDVFAENLLHETGTAFLWVEHVLPLTTFGGSSLILISIFVRQVTSFCKLEGFSREASVALIRPVSLTSDTVDKLLLREFYILAGFDPG